MEYLDNITPEQLAILHKITLFKYKPSAQYLITMKEYDNLSGFLKGYAWQFQQDFAGCKIITGVEVDTPAFQAGVEQAKKEAAMRNERAESVKKQFL